MAELTVILASPAGKEYTVNNLTNLEFAAESDAACDGLKLTFLCDKEPFEIHTVTLFCGEEKVFFGYCDKQKYSTFGDGYTVFLYARSSAALLVDNEAQPSVYYAPGTAVLCRCEAKPFGFRDCLPALAITQEYIVSKGTSCYGAINHLVRFLTDRSVRVSPDNALYLPEGRGTVNLDDETVVSETKCINRALPFTQIDYKVDGDSAYIRHYKSRLAEERGIRRTRKVNIAALPLWQREHALLSRLQNACEKYRETKVVIDGIRFFPLFDKAEFAASKTGLNGAYHLHKITVLHHADKSETHLTFRKKLDLKEVNYVAE